MKYEAVVRSRFVALHHWPDAPKEVEFLREPHRHEFHVEVVFSQTHDDRDVEYILTKRWLDGRLDKYRDKFIGTRSCEQVADEIITSAIGNKLHPIRCSVFEDGENGAVVHA